MKETAFILIVEDEPDLLHVIAKALTDEGYVVDLARDGESGLEKAIAWDYDAIVLDLMLPGKDGWQVLQELRRSKKTPVLILTAKDGESDLVDGLDRGADDYLVKPFRHLELMARLRAIIRRSAGVAKSTVEIGDVVVDTASRTLLKSGRLVNLTAREFALVEILALNRGTVVTRTMLYEHLFDENEDTLSNLLDVHVFNIRRKLSKDFITTRRGQGYVIDA